MISVLMVTLDRYELLAQCMVDNMKKAGTEDYEFLSCDNGSTDPRVPAYVAHHFKPVYHRLNVNNEGYAPCLNQMILRAAGDFICVVDPDITLPNDWLRKLVEVNKAIPESGISGYHCVLAKHPAKIVNGMEIHPGDVHGIKFFHSSLLEHVGYFCEDYKPYGIEDGDMLARCNMAGLLNYYIGGGDSSVHIGDDCGSNTPYRKMKWASLHAGHPIFQENLKRYRETGIYFVPAPVEWLDDAQVTEHPYHQFTFKPRI